MQKEALQRVRSIADYQFGRGIGNALFPGNVDISFSQRTGRIRHVYFDGKLLATLRPTVGLFSLTIQGARRIIQVEPRRLFVEVQDDVADFIAKGRSVFAKHIVDCDIEIRPQEEVIAVNSQHKVLAVGRAMLNGSEMRAFRSGTAVRVRRGIFEKEREG